MNTVYGRLREAERDCSNLNRTVESLRAKVKELEAENEIQRNAYQERFAECDKYRMQLTAEQSKVKVLTDVLFQSREALQFANDSPNGPINDTIWMMHRPETLFDFMDAALATVKDMK